MESNHNLPSDQSAPSPADIDAALAAASSTARAVAQGKFDESYEDDDLGIEFNELSDDEF